jgi:triosephosphate isomerase
VGETLDERERGDIIDVVGGQLQGSLEGVSPTDMVRVAVAYEPVWAIGTGKTATPQQAQEMHAFIREWLGGRFGGNVASSVPILYGGSVKPENIQGLMAMDDIDGALVGGASLKASSFAQIVRGGKSR